MKQRLAKTTLAAMAFLCANGLAWGQQQSVDLGKREYDSNCAGCHGPTGKGDGTYLPYLTKTPTDLTTLAKANNGVFPYQKAYEIIDGRQTVAAHGPRDMPIWGADYLSQSPKDWDSVMVFDRELYVRARIAALLDYLNRLQVK